MIQFSMHTILALFEILVFFFFFCFVIHLFIMMHVTPFYTQEYNEYEVSSGIVKCQNLKHLVLRQALINLTCQCKSHFTTNPNASIMLNCKEVIALLFAQISDVMNLFANKLSTFEKSFTFTQCMCNTYCLFGH